MRAGTRWGVMGGCAITPFTMHLLFRYQPDMYGPATVWVAVAAPLALWLAAETAVRVRRRARWLSYLLALVGLIAAGAWWYWLYGLLASGNTTTTNRIGMPTTGIAVYIAAAVVSGLRRSRKSPAHPAESVEAVTQ